MIHTSLTWRVEPHLHPDGLGLDQPLADMRVHGHYPAGSIPPAPESQAY